MSTRNVVISDGSAIDQSERDGSPDYDTAVGAGMGVLFGSFADVGIDD